MDQFSFKSIVESVKDRIKIEEYISSKIEIDRNNKAVCPFHDDNNPSFSINPKGQYFHCFGCGAGGDVLTFVQMYERVSFVEAVSRLASHTRTPIENFDSNYLKQLEEENRLREILTVAANHYHQNLSVEARRYLIDTREISEDIIQKFRIGYANGGLRDFLIKDSGYSMEHCLKLGVLNQDRNGQVRDFFYNRIIFPNMRRGHVVHLTGRILGSGEPKYMHLPGKLQYLYNEDALFENEVIIAEGILDCLSAVQAGFNAVSTYGTSLFNEDHAPKFKIVESIQILMDSDNPGRKAALAIGRILGDRATIVTLPDDHDLNDFMIEKGRPELEGLLNDGKDFIRYQIDEIDPSIDKLNLRERLDSVLNDISCLDEFRAEAYLSGIIKSRFSLKNNEVEPLRKTITEIRNKRKALATKKQNIEKQPIPTAKFEGLVDIVEWDDKPAFLIKKGSVLEIQFQVETDDKTFVPPKRDQIPFLLPRGAKVLEFQELNNHLPPAERDSALYIDLIKYFESVSEMPSEYHYDLLVAWTLHTYVFDQFQYSPIICLFAVPERGKSRTGKGLINVAYRGVHVESLRDPYLVRLANNFGSSVFFDVKDIWRKAEKSGSEDILLHRFEKGAKVPRVLYPEKGAFNDTVYYDIYGPTLIATNEGVHKILETRCISVNMPISQKAFESDVTPQSALALKERLVEFRARYLGSALPDIYKPAPGRLGDITKPLLQVILLTMPNRAPMFLHLIEEFRQSRKLETAFSLEGEILNLIVDMENLVQNGTLPVKVITDRFNESLNDRHKLTYQKIGRRLTAMGFKKAKTGDGSSAILWNKMEIDRMKSSYGLTETSETPETSDSPGFETTNVGVSDLSGVTGVSPK